jgi:N-acyl-D-amino-acid deacylase
MIQPYDVLIKDATIVDGTGKPGFKGSVAIRGETIAAVGQVSGEAAKVIDGDGLVACPGFVDTHSHADSSILQYPLAENLVMQGITTFVGGNCGFSMAPVQDPARFEQIMQARRLDVDLSWRTFGEWLTTVEKTGISPNYAPLVGHSTVREVVMGDDFKRKATADEIEEMKGLVDEAMRSGAVGLSAGLDAAWAGHFADVDAEIVPLARIAQAYGGFFAPHTRHHQNQWPVADPSEYGYGIFHAPTGEIIAGRYHGLMEAVEISRKANRAQLHIAHFTPIYIIPQPHPRYVDEVIARASLEAIIDEARHEGLDVTFNALGWEQSIGSEVPIIDSFFARQLLLPDWLRAMSQEEFADRLEARDFREKVKGMVYSGKFKFGMVHPLTDPYWMDCYRVLRSKTKAYEGRTIWEIARERQPDSIIEAVYDESLEVVFDIVLEDPGATWALVVDKRESGALPTFFKHPAGLPCTDVSALPAGPPTEKAPGRGIPPIAYGMYPHYIRTYVKELGTLSLEEAIKKVTSFPAQEVLKLKDRGVVQEGACADLVVFDFEQIKESDDFLEPWRPPEGIEHVLVNGKVVYEKGAHTGERPGKVLRRSR